MAAEHLPRDLGGLAMDKRRTRSNKRRPTEKKVCHSSTMLPGEIWRETDFSKLELHCFKLV